MSLPLSREVGALLQMAKKIADDSHARVSSAHVLLAMFHVPNQAVQLLHDRAITAGRLQTCMSGLGSEAKQVLEKVHDRSERLASGSRSEAVTSLHLLAALVRESSSQAYGILQDCGADIGAIRTAVMSYATSSRRVPRRYRELDAVQITERTEGSQNPVPRRVQEMEKKTLTPIGFHPSLGVDRGKSRTGNFEPVSKPVAREPSPQQAETQREKPPKARKSALKSEPKKKGRRPTNNGRGGIDSLRETGGGLALDNHPGINRGGKPRRRRAQPQEPTDADRRAEALDEARKTTRDLAMRLFAKKSAQEEMEDQVLEPVGLDESSEAVGLEQRSEPIEGVSQWQKPDPELAKSYELDEEEFPFLVEFGRNLTVEAALGKIDTVIGRDGEIAQLIDILGKRRSNNPLLVGEAGVGKTAIVEGLARRMVKIAQTGSAFGKRRIIELEMGRLLSGTHLRGAFSERLLEIKDEVARAEGEVIVFLDEVHTWMSAGAGGDGGDAAGELKTALARGKFPCIGATTHDECRKFVESDPAFERRFQRVTVDEPDEATAIRIIEGVRTHYERYHQVTYSPEALVAAVSMAIRYIHDRQLPDKAIGVIDLAGSRAARQGEKIVDRQAVARVVADVAGIPAERLTGSDGARFLKMEEFLSDGVVGHRDVVGTISDLLRRNYAGFRSQRPIGSLLFLGPTGVGKTEMVKVLADFLFHDREAIVRLDMSEFMEAHSVSRFIGAPPGYVGYDQGGQLTEAIRQRPYQVVLLDEIEKAHPDVLNLLLQLFDEGRLTDGRGRIVDFSNALVVMTSNLGSGVFDEEVQTSERIGFSRREKPGEGSRDWSGRQTEVLDSAREHFTPELWNRIDERLVFAPLSRDEIAEIAQLQLADSQRRLWQESGIEMKYEPAVIDLLIRRGGYDKKLGARPMRQTIQRLVEGAVARKILSGQVVEGMCAVVDVAGEEIVVRVMNSQ